MITITMNEWWLFGILFFASFYGCFVGIWMLHGYQKRLGAGWFPFPFKDIEDETVTKNKHIE